jgi:hypothetical protein
MALKKIDLVDPLGSDYDARDKRGKAVQRELVIETHAREWIKTDLVESLMVELGTMTCSILAGIPDAVRSLGVSEKVVDEVSRILDEAKLQIAGGLESIASETSAAVESMESDLEDRANSIPDEPRQDGAPRRPRGVAGAPKRKRAK